MIGGINIFQAFTEKYYTSSKRKKENDFLYNYHIIFGLFFISFPFIFVIFIIISHFGLLFFNIAMNVFFYAMIILLIIVAMKYSPKKLKEAKKLKLADEIYLDRVKSLRLKDLFLDNYKFSARMVKIYGKEKTSLFYSMIGSILFVLIMIIYDSYFKIFSEFFNRNIVVLIFSAIGILLFFIARYMWQKRINEALDLVYHWRGRSS